MGEGTADLVGREAELGALRVAQATGELGRIVSAPPGMGRSSLLHAIVDEWRGRRIDVVSIRATASSRRLRYAALSPVLSEQVDRTIDGPLTFDLVHDLLVERARRAERSLVIAIDDTHLVDEASLRVIADIVGEPRTFVVATIDETSIGLDPLTATGSLPVVELAPLSPTDIARMVVARTGNAADAGTWWSRSQGNPSALLHAIDDPSIADAAAIPSGLDGGARRLLAIVAVAEPLPLHDRPGAADHVDARALDDLVARGLVAIVTEQGRSTLRLRHPGRGPGVRRELGALEGRAARRTALAIMRAAWPALTATDRLRLAGLALDAGADLTDRELLDVVALAPAAGDQRIALGLARRGVQQLGRFEDLRRLADVAHEQGSIDDVLASIDAMTARASTIDEHLAVAVASSQHALWRRADAQAAIEALDRSPAAEVPELLAVRARLLATVGRAAPAVTEGAALCSHPDPRVRIQAALAVAHGLRRSGRPAEAVAVLDEALASADAVVDPLLSASGQVIAVGRVLAMTEAGRWADALAEGARVVAYAERYDERAGRGVALLVDSIASIESGSPARALAPLADAIEVFAELHQPAGRRWAHAARALAHGLMADAAAARADLAELDRIGPHPADLFPSIEPRARAWALVAAADPESARAVLRAGLARLRREGAFGPAWSLAHDLLSLDQPGDLLELEPSAGEPLTEVRRRHAMAVQSRDLPALSALTDEYERLGAMRWAAECAAAHSRAAARSGSREAARRADDRFGSLRARCAGLDIPALVGGPLLTLSVREREVALLAARGLSSREIAERLGVSVRTVDNHLSRCFDKLGTRSRADLAALLDR